MLTSVNNKAVCLICQNSIAQTKEYDIKKYFKKNHGGKYGKYTIEERKQPSDKLARGLQAQQQVLTRTSTTDFDNTAVSFKIARILCKHQKPFFNDEIVKECLMAFAESKCPQVVKSVSDVSLSRRTVIRRVEDMSSDIKYQIKVKVNVLENNSLTLDESTDISDTAQLAVFIQTVEKDFNVLEELIDLNAMKDTTGGIDVFEGLQSSLQKIGIENFSKCISVATDGTPLMVGCHNGLIAKVGELKRDVVAVHCIIHQENLSAKVMDMEHVTSVVVKTVTCICSRGLNYREFQEVLGHLESQRGDVVYFTDVR